MSLFSKHFLLYIGWDSRPICTRPKILFTLALSHKIESHELKLYRKWMLTLFSMPVIMRLQGPLPGAPDQTQQEQEWLHKEHTLSLKFGTTNCKFFKGRPTIHDNGCLVANTWFRAAKEGNGNEGWQSVKESRIQVLFIIFAMCNPTL